MTEDTFRADALAKSMLDKNYDTFWKDVNVMNNSKVPYRKLYIDGISGESDIASMSMNCYKSLFNMNARNKVTAYMC